jgi:hypothetical protein
MLGLQKNKSKKRKTSPITSHVKIQTREEVERIARTQGLSISKVTAAFIEEGIRQKLHIQHAVLLQPIIETAIHKEMVRNNNRLALLLVRVAFDTGQVRTIVKNILQRQPDEPQMTAEKLNKLLDHSSERARYNITHKTPQLAAVIEEVEKWFQEEMKKDA